LPGDLDPGCATAALVAALRGAGMPLRPAGRTERVDQIIDQLEQWLGLRPVPPAESDSDEGVPRDDGTPIAQRPDEESGTPPDDDVAVADAFDPASGAEAERS
jgi:hypothetical protein